MALLPRSVENEWYEILVCQFDISCIMICKIGFDDTKLKIVEAIIMYYVFKL